MGDYAKAEPLYRQALRDQKKVLGEKHPDYATSLNNLALLYKDMGDYAKAEPLYRQALEIRKQALGEKHPDYAKPQQPGRAVRSHAGNGKRLPSISTNARRVIRRHVARVLPSLGEKEQLTFLQQTDSGPFYRSLSLGLTCPTI